MRLLPMIRRSEAPSLAWPEASRFFEDFFDGFPFDGLQEWSGNRWLPAVDVLERDGNLILRAELPGIDQKDIDLQIEGNVLTLRGERKTENDEKKSDYHRRETVRGAFCRSFTLPETVDGGKIKADYKNGVLTVTIPQKPEAKPREIPVTVN